MDSNLIATLLIAALGNGFIVSIVQFIFNRIDAKSGTKKKLDTLANDFEEYKATLARTHILRFADELHNNMEHSEEYFKQTLLDIDTYDRYCESHPSFANGLTVLSSQYIKDEYKRVHLTTNVESKA